MKRYLKYNLILLMVLVLVSCSKESDSGQSYSPSITSGSQTGSTNTTTTVPVPAAPYEEGDYIWKNLNYYYYWQEFVANLSDSKATSASSYASFINENPNPEDFFNSLKHQDDRFSGIVPDYDILLDLFQGTVESDGIHHVIFAECNGQNAFAFVTYVDKNSNAMSAGIVRGHIITSVNGTSLTVNNASDLMNNNNSSNTYGLGEYENNIDDTCANISSNGEMVTLDKSILNNNPVYVGGVWDNDNAPEWEATFGVPLPRVGYILYNKFAKENEDTGENYDEYLNSLFAFLKWNEVEELVIDLRFNGGGYMSSL